MQVILDSSFARPGSVPLWGGKKEEFGDWTTEAHDGPLMSCMTVRYLEGEISMRTGSRLGFKLLVTFNRGETEFVT